MVDWQSMETNGPGQRGVRSGGVTLKEAGSGGGTGAEAELNRTLRTLMVVAAFGPGSAYT